MTEPRSSQPDGKIKWTEDSRYAISRRELVVTIIFFAVYTAAMIGLAWALGGGESSAEIRFVLGFPAWFFWSTLVLGGVFCIVPYFVVKAFFTDMSLEAEPEPQSSPTRNGETSE